MKSKAPCDCLGDGSDLDPASGRCGFLCEDWSDPFVHEHEAVPSFPLFRADALTLDPPEADIASECQRLLGLEASRTRQREKQIEGQVDDAGVLLPLIKALGLLRQYRRVDLPRADVIQRIAENLRPPIFVLKRRFLRARPSRMCPTLRPMFPQGSSKHYPGHPSYPSGHATQAYAWAHLFALKLNSRHHHLCTALMSAAANVAENRECAGLHYASDTRAGMALGEQMATAIIGGGKLSDADFELLMPGLT